MELLGRTFAARALALAFTVTVLSVPAQAGRIVANNDEWATSNTGYTLAGAASANNFVFNLATFLAGSGGNILVYSDLFALNQSSFKASLSQADLTSPMVRHPLIYRVITRSFWPNAYREARLISPHLSTAAAASTLRPAQAIPERRRKLPVGTLS